MNDKITQLKPKKKVPMYFIICEGNRNPHSSSQTYNIDAARGIRDQLEDLWSEYWNDEFGCKPLTNRYSINVN